jgi:hypothetical protein
VRLGAGPERKPSGNSYLEAMVANRFCCWKYILRS